MSKSSDRLHFYGVHFFKLVVQNSRGVDYLESCGLVVSVAHIECFGGEGVRLHFHIGFADTIDETGLAYIGVPS